MMALNLDEPHCCTPRCLVCTLRDVYHDHARNESNKGFRATGLAREDFVAASSGTFVGPLTDAKLEEIAGQLVNDRQHFWQNMIDLFQTIYVYDSQPATYLLLLEGVLHKLIPLVLQKPSDDEFAARLDAYLSHYPRESRHHLRIEILNEIKKLEPLLKLVLLRFIFEESNEQTVTR